jgi:hypothetical protein
MSIGAYAFLAFEDSEQLLPAVEFVRSLEGVRHWHAVEGHYHLAVAVDTGADTAITALRSLPGLADLAAFHLSTELIAMKELSPEHIHAYLIMETDPSTNVSVAEQLASMSDLHWVMLAVSDIGMIGILQSPGYDTLDRSVDRHLRPLDGILRLKRDWILDLTQL